MATQVHAGQTLATYDIVISDDRGRRVCTARLSCLLRKAVPGGCGPAARRAWRQLAADAERSDRFPQG